MFFIGKSVIAQVEGSRRLSFAELDKKDNVIGPLIVINDVKYEKAKAFRMDPYIVKSFDIQKNSPDSNFSAILKINTLPDKQVVMQTLPEILAEENIKDNSPFIFLVDQELVDFDPNLFYIDRNYILSISVKQIKIYDTEQIINSISIYTKTKQNIKKSKEIKIR